MPKPGDLVAGKYVIEELLGEGGMGAVFSATHRFTGKQVAIKWMLPELARDQDAVQRFMREAQAAGRINHPNVVDVYDVGQHEDSFFLVMELLRGEPFTNALSRRELSVREVLDVVLRAMRGVSAAHRQGVVHRDLKPDNIFLAYDDDGGGREPKVLDFGISKVSNEGQLNPRLTRTGAVVGTPYYMPPEQIRGSDNLDRRADIYAFGVILYEALTGQVPFVADTYGALVLEIATGTPKTPEELMPGLPSDLSRIVMKAMARQANDRFPDIESLIRALEPFLHDSIPQRNTPTGPEKWLRTSGSNNPKSTPFTAEPPAEDPRLLGTPNGRVAMYVTIGLGVLAVVWILVATMRDSSPTLILVPPQPIQAAQPNPAEQLPAAATQQPIEQLPIIAPPPVFEPNTPAEAPAAAASDNASASKWKQQQPAAAKPAVRHWKPRSDVPEPAAAAPTPAEKPAATPAQPAERSVDRVGRRARSGPLSVDDF